MSVKVAVLDEDPLAREKILRLLRGEDEVEVVAVWSWIGDAFPHVRQTEADILFLNIQAPTPQSLKILDALGPGRTPVIVFVTTYDPSLVGLFDKHGIDYLLKPFDAGRFRAALARARGRVKQVGASGSPMSEYRLLRTEATVVRPRSHRWLGSRPVYLAF